MTGWHTTDVTIASCDEADDDDEDGDEDTLWW